MSVDDLECDIDARAGKQCPIATSVLCNACPSTTRGNSCSPGGPDTATLEIIK